jgi:hypothetical protein
VFTSVTNIYISVADMTIYATKITVHIGLNFIAILDSDLSLKEKGKEAVASCRLRLTYPREKTFRLFYYEYCQTRDVVSCKSSLNAEQKRELSTVV